MAVLCRASRLHVFARFILLSLLGSLGGLMGLTAPAQAVTVTSELPLYVSNFDNDSVTLYAPGANGDATPIATVAGPRTGLDEPLQIAVDSAGKLYVANGGNDSITVYPPGANGNVTPIATIAGPDTGLHGPQGLAIDATGVLYVSNFGLLPSGLAANSITAYAPGANGNVAPIATIAGPNTGLQRPSAVAVDASGRIYAVNFAPPFPGTPPGSIKVYPAGANGNVAPIATITDSTTGMRGVQAMTIDASGNIVVTQTFARVVTKYPSTANGNVAPVAVIAGPNTGLAAPIGVAADPVGRLAVANYNSDTVTKYPPGATGNAAPIATIAGPRTGLSGPTGLAFAVNCGSVISGQQSGGVIASSGTTCLPGAQLSGSIYVAAGATLLVQGSTISGSISVAPGATLIVDGSSVAGSISARSPQSFRLCGSAVGGWVVITSPRTPAVIGAQDQGCAPNAIGGGTRIG